MDIIGNYVVDSYEKALWILFYCIYSKVADQVISKMTI